jgi:hypothetical protein
MPMTQQFGTTSADAANGIGIVDDRIYVIGSTRGTFPGQLQYGIQDVFFLRLGEDGSISWLHQIGTPQLDSGMTISSSPGNLYVSGTTFGNFDDSTVTLAQSAGFLFQFPSN